MKRLASDAHRWFGLLFVLYVFSAALVTPQVQTEAAGVGQPSSATAYTGSAASSQATSRPDSPRVAVADFVVTGDVGISEAGKAVSELLLTEIDKSRFQLVERSLLVAILKETDLSIANLTEDPSLLRGKNLKGVRYLVVGSVVKLGSLSISARLVDVKTGEIVESGKVSAKDAQGLQDALGELVRKLQMAPEAPALSPEEAKAQAVRLRAGGIESALAGRFARGLEDLRKSLKLAPDDPVAAAAAKLLEEHLARLTKVKDERAAEYQQTVMRVRRANLAQEFLSNQPNAATRDKLRKQVVEVVIAAFNKTNVSDSLENIDDQAATKIRANCVKALTDSLAGMEGFVDLLKDLKGAYPDTLRELAALLQKQLRSYLSAWKTVELQTPADRHAAGKKLRALEAGLFDALTDVEAMIAEKPWRAALGQARLAKELADDKEKMAKEQWYRDLIADMEARGKQAVKDANWQDALNVYVVLEDLEDNNESYKELAKTVERHVRVLGLYGRKPGEARSPTRPSTEPGASRPVVEEEPTWQKLVEGVDARMVEAAISQLAQSYVTTVDYRKVTHGALNSIKVLAETPQAVYAFKGLADEKKKADFLAAIDKELQNAERKDRLDNVDLHLALNAVLEASERTVGIPTEVLAVEFTDGFLDELDKFSSMVWPHDVADFEKTTMGHFFGVGIQIAKEPGEPLKVVEPLLGTPAYKAGIKAGDLVLAVDGRRTEDMPIDKLVQMIMGPKGSKVLLQIKRPGLVEPLEIPVVRDQINTPTVKGWQRTPDGDWTYLIDTKSRIAYIRLTQFTEQTVPDTAEVLKALRQLGIRSLILDLRFNPGGLLRSATTIADEFLRTGRIVSTSGRQFPEAVSNATPAGEFQDGDLLVLVNQYSASAAEILSGAIKDWRRGLIIGQRTYGKGSVQNVIPVRQGLARLKLTTQYYYLPSGRLLHRRNGDKTWGVDPDVDVFMTPKQTKQWLEIRRKTDLLQNVQPDLLKTDLAEQLEADVQLNTAVLLAKLMKLQEGKGLESEVAEGASGK